MPWSSLPVEIRRKIITALLDDFTATLSPQYKATRSAVDSIARATDPDSLTARRRTETLAWRDLRDQVLNGIDQK